MLLSFEYERNFNMLAVLLVVLCSSAGALVLPQQFTSVEHVSVNPAAPKVVPGANFTRERWFDAAAGRALTVATFAGTGATEGQFIDVGADRQCNFHSSSSSSSSSSSNDNGNGGADKLSQNNVSCQCQPIPAPYPLANPPPPGTLLGLAVRQPAWASPPGANVTCEVWSLSVTVPGSIARPAPATETCHRFVEHAPPHREAGAECWVCAAAERACGPGAPWLTAAPFLAYVPGAPDPAVLVAPPQCA